MRRLMPLSGLLLICGFSVASAQTQAHSRGYVWGFEHGNLVPNWSFENNQDFWVDNTATGEYTVQTHYKTASVTGSFCARVNGYYLTTASQGRLISSRFRVEPGVYYSLSFYYKASGVVGNTVPYVMFWPSNIATTYSGVAYGPVYANSSSWQAIVINFQASSDAQFAQIVMAGSSVNGHGGDFYFDDVVLEEGGYFTAEDVAARRARIPETVGFGDAFGRSPQSQTKLAASNYLVGGVGFDGFARPETTFLATPYYGIAPGFRSDLVTQANAFYGSTGPFDAHGAAFSRVLYADEPSPRVVEMGAPDTAWALGHAHTVKSGFYYRNDYTIPSNIQSPGVDATAREFRLSWTKGEDSTYTLTWTNRLGQVVRTSTNLTKSSSGANTWSWSHTMPDYYRMGQARRIRTPLDVQANDSTFAEINEYDARGQVISTWSKTKGLTRFWYNKLGQLRYSQDSGQVAAGQYTYSDYDKLGRLRAKGIKNGGILTQATVDLDTTTGTKYEKVGYIYDDLSTFQARTGKTLFQLVPHNAYLPTGNTWGRLVCAYNRNDDLISSPFTDMDRYVVECYGYDARGNRTTTLKSIHPIRDPVKKFQDAHFIYDEQNRLIQAYNYADHTSGAIPAMTFYTYDMQGRVASVTGPAGVQTAQFVYCDWGPVCSVTLGGDGTGTQGTRIDYAYHPRGGVKSIKATNLTAGTITFEEFLGYESKSYNHASVPAPIKAKYDGTITQMLYHFASDVNSLKPVRLVNYDYDQLGRMLKADAQKNSSADPFLSSGAISFPVSWTNGTESDSKVAYDLNGRITGQRTGNISVVDSAVYIYNTGTYKLNRVTGKVNEVVTRVMSASNNFVYDARGNMTQDKSKTTQLNIVYGWDKMPVTFTFNSLGPKTTYTFYDAGGNRVSAIDKVGSNYVYGRHYINMGPGLSREWNESYSGSGPTITGTAHTVNLYAHAQVGRVTPGGEYEYFVKNHLGSTMKTVGQNGNEPTGGGTDYDYLAYGDLRKLKENASPVTQKYTTKEYEDLSRLYYFGARFYDPELGVWTRSDPVGQFNNPYAFGSDPINGIDPNGMVWDIFRPSKYESFAEDAGGLIYRKTGEAKDAVGHTIMDFGRGLNDIAEKSWNKAFSYNCHYESNETCRDRWTGKINASNAITQLYQLCAEGDASACQTISEIGGDPWNPNNDYGNSALNSELARRLATLIASGGHTVGINFSVGGGVIVPTVQYDNTIIPLGPIKLGSQRQVEFGGDPVEDAYNNNGRQGVIDLYSQSNMYATQDPYHPDWRGRTYPNGDIDIYPASEYLLPPFGNGIGFGESVRFTIEHEMMHRRYSGSECDTYARQLNFSYSGGLSEYLLAQIVSNCFY